MNRRHIKLSLAFLSALFLVLTGAEARALNVQLLRPSTGAVQGYQLYTSDTLPEYGLSLGMEVNYVQHPLEVGRFGGNQRFLGIVDRFVTGDFLAEFGMIDWCMVRLDIPFNFYHNIAPVLIPNRDTGYLDMGDIMIDAKFVIFDARKTEADLGLAVVPFITFPSGDESIYFGDVSLTGGLWLVGDAQWKNNRFYLNIGTKFRKREQIANLVVKHEFLYGIGFQRPLWKRGYLDIIVEVFGSTTYSKFFTEEVSSPVQGHIMLQKKWLDQRLVTHLGGGLGFNNGYGSPDFRFMAGVSYTFSFDQQKEPASELE